MYEYFIKCDCIMWILTFLNFSLLIVYVLTINLDSTPIWGFECVNSKCLKIELNSTTLKNAVSHQACQLFCGVDLGTLWPKPNGFVSIGNYLAKIDISSININPSNIERNKKFWIENEKRFLEQLHRKLPKSVKLDKDGKSLVIDIYIKNDDSVLTMNTNESYKITASKDISTESISIKIESETIYGGRHGLETLSQLIVYDSIRQELQVIEQFEIHDAPAFKHRGLLLDTARNYFSINSIKRTIDAMAMVKLNTFHWHITDTHSFPFEVLSHPELTKYGAYSPEMVYTHNDIKDLVTYANIRGVRIIPEYDAPAHVGEGFQKTNLVTCFNEHPWFDFCVEPPCGQFDPTKEQLYDVLEDIYREMYTVFGEPDVFHMGGDEVSTVCWNSSSDIQTWMTEKGWNFTESDFMKLWNHFQTNALSRFDKIASKKLPIILWTSRLTEIPYIDDHLDPNRYIIQIWTTGADVKVKNILERGYNIIVSNYDALYFDCGFAGWVTDGNNWCSPYIGWQKVYDNDLSAIAVEDQYKSQILGAEAALWSEQADEEVLDARFWPRASALAERLWTNPTDTWRSAVSRMLLHRERLVENGIASESLQPKWCLQNQQECII